MGQIGLRSIMALNSHDHSSASQYGSALKPTDVDIFNSDVPGVTPNALASLSLERNGDDQYIQFLQDYINNSGLLWSDATKVSRAYMYLYPTLGSLVLKYDPHYMGFNQNGNIILGSSLTDGGQIRGIVLNVGTAPTSHPADKAFIYSKDVAPGFCSIHVENEGGHIIKFFQSASLTAKNASVVDTTYGAEEAAVIGNNRTRIEEIESRLQAFGFL